MRVSVLYWLLALIGGVVPLAAVLPWLGQHGIDVPLLLSELFSNRVSAFFGLDVLLSAAALLVLIAVDGRRSGTRFLWLAIAATCLVGVSCGLPLFLALREHGLRRIAGSA